MTLLPVNRAMLRLGRSEAQRNVYSNKAARLSADSIRGPPSFKNDSGSLNSPHASADGAERRRTAESEAPTRNARIRRLPNPDLGPLPPRCWTRVGTVAVEMVCGVTAEASCAVICHS
jgi:hypothetical protein